jgi:hypothetical protein
MKGTIFLLVLILSGISLSTKNILPPKPYALLNPPKDITIAVGPVKEKGNQKKGKKPQLWFQVVKTLPNPVIRKNSPGAENIPGGFEGGSSVKLTIDGKSEYHFFTHAYPRLDWSLCKLDHWGSPDAVNFHQAGVVLENYRDEKAAMNHIYCSPIPYYDEKSERWCLIYCEFVHSTTWDG